MMFLFLILSGIALAESQMIKDYRNGKNRKPLFLSGWWVNDNWLYSNLVIDFLMRYVLAWFKDGYHFCKGVGISSIVLFGIFNPGFFAWYYDFVIFSAAIGLSFNLRFHL